MLWWSMIVLEYAVVGTDGSYREPHPVRLRGESEMAEYYTIRSVVKASQVLGAFTVDRPELGVAELSRILRLNKTVVQKLVLTLLDQRLLQQDLVSRKYRLGPRIVEIAGTFLAGNPLASEGSKCVQELAREIGYSTGLGVLDGSQVLYMQASEANATIRAASRMGDRMPLHATASGKCILAFLSESERDSILGNLVLEPFTPNTTTSPEVLLSELAAISKQGYAVNDGERIVGLCGVAAPVFDHEGNAIAAISVAIPRGVMPECSMDQVIQATLRSAEVLTNRLGGVQRRAATGP